MNDKELYQQKKEAQLAEWKADIDKLKAKASMASADVQLEMNKQIATLEDTIEKGKLKLSELTKATEEAYVTIKAGVESSWDSLKSTFTEAAEKFKR